MVYNDSRSIPWLLQCVNSNISGLLRFPTNGVERNKKGAGLSARSLAFYFPAEYLADVAQVQKHMNCLCKKKIHKNCPKHNATVAMKMVFDQRAPLGDKLLYLQSRNTAPKQSIILP